MSLAQGMLPTGFEAWSGMRSQGNPDSGSSVHRSLKDLGTPSPAALTQCGKHGPTYGSGWNRSADSFPSNIIILF